MPTPEKLMKISKLQSERVLVAPARNCPHRLVLTKNESDIFYISKCGTPGGTWTPDNQVRSLVLQSNWATGAWANCVTLQVRDQSIISRNWPATWGQDKCILLSRCQSLLELTWVSSGLLSRYFSSSFDRVREASPCVAISLVSVIDSQSTRWWDCLSVAGPLNWLSTEVNSDAFHLTIDLLHLIIVLRTIIRCNLIQNLIFHFKCLRW